MARLGRTLKACLVCSLASGQANHSKEMRANLYFGEGWLCLLTLWVQQQNDIISKWWWILNPQISHCQTQLHVTFSCWLLKENKRGLIWVGSLALVTDFLFLLLSRTISGLIVLSFSVVLAPSTGMKPQNTSPCMCFTGVWELSMVTCMGIFKYNLRTRH